MDSELHPQVLLFLTSIVWVASFNDYTTKVKKNAVNTKKLLFSFLTFLHFFYTEVTKCDF